MLFPVPSTRCAPLETNRPGFHGSTTASSALPADDRDLIAAIAQENVSALDDLYRRHRQAAFAAAFTLLRDHGAAEDAVHDAFLKIWRAAASFDASRGAPRCWLLAIVRNAALDQLRGHQTARRHEPAIFRSLSAPSGSDDISSSVATAMEAERLRAALDALPAEQRHALELAFFAGLTHGEIARRTGAPLGTVKGRVRLGLRRLRHDLRDLDPNRHSLPAEARTAA